MRLRYAVIVLGTFAALASDVSIAKDGQAILSTVEVLSVIVGNTIRYQNDAEDAVNEYYAPDGTIRGHSKANGAYDGVWQIRFGNQSCFVHADPMESGCIGVVIRGDRIEFQRRDGIAEGPFELRRENPAKL
jgi:hypothetical protein